QRPVRREDQLYGVLTELLGVVRGTGHLNILPQTTVWFQGVRSQGGTSLHVATPPARTRHTGRPHPRPSQPTHHADHHRQPRPAPQRPPVHVPRPTTPPRRPAHPNHPARGQHPRHPHHPASRPMERHQPHPVRP